MATYTYEYEMQKALKMILNVDNADILGAIIKNGENRGNLSYTLNQETKRPEVSMIFESFVIRATAYQDMTLTSPIVNRLLAPESLGIDFDDIEEGAFYINKSSINLTYNDSYHTVTNAYNVNTYGNLLGFIYKDKTGEIKTINPTQLTYTQNPASVINTSGVASAYPFSFYGFSNLNYKRSSGKLSASYRIFTDKGGAINYLNTGDDSGEIGGGGGTEEVPAEDRTTVLYYNDRVSVTTFGFNDTTDYFTHSIQFKIQYKTNAGEKITEPRNSIVGYVKSSVDPVTFSNIEWVYNENVKIVESKWSYGLVGGTKHTGTNPPDDIPDILCFYDQAQIDNKVYKAKFGTNMVIFANKSDAERFAEGDKTVRPLYDGHSGRFDDTGDIGDKYSYNTQSYTIDNDMSSVWILTKEQLNELASVLATGLTKSEAESGQTLLNITKTTARSFTAQAEPVDMICDLFWVPIDVSEFCITHTDYLQFGQDTYGAAGALDEFVDETTGQVVKAARTSSRSIEALTGGIFETIGSAVSDSKLNVRSESVTPPPSNN